MIGLKFVSILKTCWDYTILSNLSDERRHYQGKLENGNILYSGGCLDGKLSFSSENLIFLILYCFRASANWVFELIM